MPVIIIAHHHKFAYCFPMHQNCHIQTLDPVNSCREKSWREQIYNLHLRPDNLSLKKKEKKKKKTKQTPPPLKKDSCLKTILFSWFSLVFVFQSCCCYKWSLRSLLLENIRRKLFIFPVCVLQAFHSTLCIIFSCFLLYEEFSLLVE